MREFPMRRDRLSFAILTFIALASTAKADPGVQAPRQPSKSSGAVRVTLLPEVLRPDWRKAWHEQRLPFRAATSYGAVSAAAAGDPERAGNATDGDEAARAVRADSVRSASGLLHPLAVERPAHLHLHWRWRVATPLTHANERTRAGDDYAARVMVVFETSLIPTRTRALNYVWAAREPVGAVFPSPYSRRVGMIVLRSGAAEAGVWQTETRDVLADYIAFFGKPPEKLSAVAIMSDTDDTRETATTWFADLITEVAPFPAAATVWPAP
jgi:hypothetical protein